MTESLPYSNEYLAPTATQIAAWQVYDVPDSALPRLTGPCPACNHTCDVTLRDRVVQGGIPAAAAALAPEPVVRLILCDCLQDHAAPAGIQAGCGRYWLASLATSGAGWALTVEHDVTRLPEATALDRALKDENKRIQATAEKWLAGITALFGLFSLSGVVTAKDALQGLGPLSRVFVAIAFLMAVAGAAISIVLGYLAGYGWPRVVSITTQQDVESWYAKQQSYAPRAARLLQAAIVAALVALALLAALVALMWFLPRAVQPPKAVAWPVTRLGA